MVVVANDQLEAFARDEAEPQLEAWRQYWRWVGRSSRSGIWHETYLVKAGQYEAVYGNMPPHGLGTLVAWSLWGRLRRRVPGSRGL